MQSLASLMSVKPTDIGNLDDFNESDEEEDKKPGAGVGTATPPAGTHCDNTSLDPTPYRQVPAAITAPSNQHPTGLVGFLCLCVSLWFFQFLCSLGLWLPRRPSSCLHAIFSSFLLLSSSSPSG